MNEMAAARRIPLVNQADFTYYGQRADPRNMEWTHDYYWNPTGHRWAAVALLEYLKRNQDVCE